MCKTRMMKEFPLRPRILIFRNMRSDLEWRSCPEDFVDSEENGLIQGYSVSLLQLPNEILYDILSFVLADADSPEDESQRKFVLVLNEVCQLFRHIPSPLPFWCEPDFDFLSLYSPPPGKPV